MSSGLDLRRVNKANPDGVIKPAQGSLFDLHQNAVTPAQTHPPSLESFTLDHDRGFIVRHVQTRDVHEEKSLIPILRRLNKTDDLARAYDEAWLRSKLWPTSTLNRGIVRLVDLFCGCGALSLGVVEACRALGLKAEPVLAVDTNKNALAVYAKNFPEARHIADPIETMIDSDIGTPLSSSERYLKDQLGHIHILIGGPPCQGHSDLNNHTRRADPKNALFLKMARFAEVIKPDHIIIENVPGVIHDEGGVVDITKRRLVELGYHVDSDIIKADRIGVPQRRRRFITAASRIVPISLKTLEASFQQEERSMAWACDDLLQSEGGGVFESAAVHSSTNQKRINYLFDNDLYDLPDSERPDCHRLKKHSYRAVYGRMYWDKPAPTITAGFGSTGQGRFVHPKFPRTLTLHEAARLQFIPDFFDFGGISRRPIQDMIGNAVPPKLSYIVALDLLR